MIQRILFYFSLGSCLVSYGSQDGDITEDFLESSYLVSNALQDGALNEELLQKHHESAINSTADYLEKIYVWIDQLPLIAEFRSEICVRSKIDIDHKMELVGITRMFSKRQRKILYTEKLRKQFGNKTEDNKHQNLM